MLPIEPKILHSYISFDKDSKPEEYYITMKGSEHSADLLHPELYKSQLKIEDADATEYEIAFSRLSDNEKLVIRRWTMTGEDKGFYSDGTPALQRRGISPFNYELNRKLYNHEPLSNSEKEFVQYLSCALMKLPRVMGDFIRLDMYRTEPSNNPWINGAIEVGDIVTNAPAFMSVSDDWVYAEETIPISKVFEEITVHAIYEFRQSKQFVPLFRGAASLTLAENEHLSPINSTFRVLGISYAEPVYENSHTTIRVGVTLEDAVEQKSLKNIHTGELL
ncbi:hypothetical protein DRE45_21355 [Salmonella enterica subsp. enterica]|nr:hypothetical protein [Salmonella enterica]ECE0302351.1 hypothetical protein [Salmonella enterica subsp. enterica serovar Javiana]EBA1652823.1 hypothetical protein [Salmonella enterica]EBC5529435.1 hypothetical protein [Salmonella enterica]EBI9831023.1 hypothetical protein [Salmonella enterica]